MTLAMNIHLFVPSYNILNIEVLVDQLANHGVIN